MVSCQTANPPVSQSHRPCHDLGTAQIEPAARSKVCDADAQTTTFSTCGLDALRAFGLNNPSPLENLKNHILALQPSEDEQPTSLSGSSARVLCQTALLFISTGRVQACCARQGDHTAAHEYASPGQSAHDVPLYALVASLASVHAGFPRSARRSCTWVWCLPQTVDLDHPRAH